LQTSSGKGKRQRKRKRRRRRRKEGNWRHSKVAKFQDDAKRLHKELRVIFELHFCARFLVSVHLELDQVSRKREKEREKERERERHTHTDIRLWLRRRRRRRSAKAQSLDLLIHVPSVWPMARTFHCGSPNLLPQSRTFGPQCV